MFSLNEFINPKLKKKSDPYKERLKIFSDKNKNLRFLLENRFLWMRPLLKNKKEIIEVGSGTGCIQVILKKNPWPEIWGLLSPPHVFSLVFKSFVC